MTTSAPFSDLPSLDAWVYRRLDQDKDVFILITGQEGQGKSTLEYHLGKRWDPTFTAERMCFTGSQFIEVSRRLPKRSFVALDEPTAGAMNREAMTRSNRDLVKFLTVCRERNLIGCVLHPNKQFVDPLIVNHRVHLWIHLARRGTFIVHFPRRSPYSPGTYWTPVFSVGAREPFPAASGPEWTRYLERKREFVEKFGRSEEALAASQQEEAMIEEYKRRLAWLPGELARISIKPRRILSRAESEFYQAYDSKQIPLEDSPLGPHAPRGRRQKVGSL